MKFSKDVLPRAYGPVEILILLGALAGLALLAVVLFAGAGGAWAFRAPSPTVGVTATAPPPTRTPGPVLTATSAPTNTSVVEEEPTATEPVPTAIPTATRFWIVPAQPPPLPTPVLPPAAPFPNSCDGPGRMNILLVGIDGFNDNYHRAARSDTIMLAGVNFGAKTAQLLSIPRDLWLPMPNLLQVPEARVNSAYHYGEFYQVPGGGPAQLSATLTAAFGVRIDRYLVVNFLAFERAIDALGGIDIHIARPLRDEQYPLRDGSGTIVIDFPAGWVHMDGATALIYARIRHDASDFSRMRRQHQVLFALRDQLLSPQTLPQLPALAQSLHGAMRTNLSWEDIGLLGCAVNHVAREAVQAWVIDQSMVVPTRFPDGAQVLLPNMEAIQPVLANFNAGE